MSLPLAVAPATRRSQTPSAGIRLSHEPGMQVRPEPQARQCPPSGEQPRALFGWTAQAVPPQHVAGQAAAALDAALVTALGALLGAPAGTAVGAWVGAAVEPLVRARARSRALLRTSCGSHRH